MNATKPNIRKRPRHGASATGDTCSLRNLPVEQVRLNQDYLPLGALKLPARQVRQHTEHQIGLIAENMKTFGQVKPIVIDSNDVIVSGVGVYQALVSLGWAKAQVVRAEHLSPELLCAYAIADNKLAELSVFDKTAVADIFRELESIDFDLTLTGFEPFEIDNIFAEVAEEGAAEVEEVPEAPVEPVSELGDLWLLGDHKLLCGNALERESYVQLMGEERATMIVTDSPYDVKIRGNVSGLGRVTRLFADLILDVSRRGDIVLDPYSGSGTTLLAAQRTGRKARCIELDPKYVDVAIERWQRATGGTAIHLASGQSFAERTAAAASCEAGDLS